ncbi:MAG: hypothetical protein SF339_17195 [Blastocatellia bacterium]|nr:hypothetical protein [Blastocatellia bacterium]
MTGSTETQIELQIEGITFTGFPAVDVDRFGLGLQAELTRLFNDAGMPAPLRGGRGSGGLQIESLTAAGNAAPEALGAQAAQAIYWKLAERE